MVYFDNAATTAVSRAAVEAMLPFFTENYGNPSSLYEAGRNAKEGLENARRTVAQCIGAESSEVYFTASGSEADNWAIKLIPELYASRGNKIITSAIEHHAVLHACQYMEKKGFEVVYLPVDEYGSVSPEDLKNAIDDKTLLVSVMYVNNEIGTVQPIAELAAIAHQNGALFHTDAVQAAGIMPIDVKALGVDLLSISAHKFHGPKGVGALYVKKGIKLAPLIHGGGQEKGKRAGTENTAYAAGMAAALSEATDNLDKKAEYIRHLRDKLIKGVMDTIPYTRLNGHPTQRQAGNANFSFRFIEGESLLLWLDMKGIAASSGSACTSGSLDPSHVLLAIGLPHEIAHGSLRISIGENNTEEEIDKLLSVLPEIVDKLRKMSPLYEEAEGGNK